MGIKSKSQANNILVNKPYEKGGLIFESREAYERLKNIDINAYQLVDAIKDGSLDMKEFFDRFDKVKVKEKYSYALQDLYEIFENITALSLIRDEDYFMHELRFSASFHSKIEVESFDD